MVVIRPKLGICWSYVTITNILTVVMCQHGTAARRAPPNAAICTIRSDAIVPIISSIWIWATGPARNQQIRRSCPLQEPQLDG